MELDLATKTMLIILAVIIGIAALAQFTIYFRDFSYELQKLNGEIKRCHGGEKKYWKRKRRRLWLSLIPFVRYK